MIKFMRSKMVWAVSSQWLAFDSLPAHGVSISPAPPVESHLSLAYQMPSQLHISYSFPQ